MPLALPEELTNYQAGLRSLGQDPTPLMMLAEALIDLPDSAFTEVLASFNIVADQSDYCGDSDYGALLLEALADTCPDPDRKRDLYEASANRAGWFAAGATAGGEGLARSIDVKRITEKLNDSVPNPVAEMP
ncbi:MAG TPA: hypothetical protein VFJ58_30080 [Armatimonadota bacterium]|nr:hypothetical protein [Armatimonadota bacterium]